MMRDINFIFSETMSLVGGVNNYSLDGKRFESETPPKGRKVYFLGRNGWNADLEEANKYFKQGTVLTVKEIYVGRSSSTVEFIEFPNLCFNTVMFADIEADSIGE